MMIPHPNSSTSRAAPAPGGERDTVIEVDGLTKRYGSLTAVDDISFGVRDGEVFGILGPNGAGKTTTLECVEGLDRADVGPDRGAGLGLATRLRQDARAHRRAAPGLRLLSTISR